MCIPITNECTDTKNTIAKVVINKCTSLDIGTGFQKYQYQIYMTRINTIPPSKLCDSHLIAEYREILRVFKLAKLDEKAPKKFILGRGHVKFFFDKLQYAHDRFNSLRQEVLDRGFKPKMEFDPEILVSKPYLYNPWKPTELSKELIRQRILERAQTMKSIRYRGELITFDQYKQLLYD
jgi:hypothetical protein